LTRVELELNLIVVVVAVEHLYIYIYIYMYILGDILHEQVLIWLGYLGVGEVWLVM
jgi:hypothetical protein